MAHLIRLSFRKLSSKQLKQIDPLFEGKSKTKFIVKRSDNVILMKPALFDYLEHDFNVNPLIKQKAKFALIEVDKSNKAKKLIDDCRYGSWDYNAMIRKIRL